MKKLIFTTVLALTGLICFSQSDCEGQRTPIHEFEDFERAILNDLILQYVQSIPNPSYDPDGPFPWNRIEYKYLIVAEHTGNGTGGQAWHNFDEYFLEWHRDYIAGLEQFILDQGCNLCPSFVPLPYWDITQPLPDEFWNQMIPEFENAFFAGAQGNPNPPHDGTASFKSDPMQTWPDYGVSEDDCTEYEDIDDFASFIQSWHSTVHVEMGGAMRATGATSGTSVFWLYHAFVDEKYYCYQQLCQCPEPIVELSNRECDVCVDFSNSTNADDFNLILIDEFGNESSVSLNSQGCISYRDLNQGDNYTLKVHAVNTSMTDNIACLNDEIEINFTAPDPPSSKFNPNPCIRATPLPQFPTTTTLTSSKVVKVTNTGTEREFTFTNSIHNTGSQAVLTSPMILEENEEVFINIPQASQGYGINYFTIHVEGESATIEYINQ